MKQDMHCKLLSVPIKPDYRNNRNIANLINGGKLIFNRSGEGIDLWGDFLVMRNVHIGEEPKMIPQKLLRSVTPHLKLILSWDGFVGDKRRRYN